MKHINLGLREIDVARITELARKWECNISEAFRKAAKIVHKKEIGNLKKLVSLFFLLMSSAMLAQTRPLTCLGVATAPGGMICTSQDATNYQDYHFSIAMRADGHGTFALSSETGINTMGTYQIILHFPQLVSIREIHGNMNIIPWCQSDGFVTALQGADTNGPIENLLWLKYGTITGTPLEQTVKGDFPLGVPVKELYWYVNNDLCAVSTVSLGISGSF